MKARNPPHSVNELTFYFPGRNKRMGLPDVSVGGRSIDIFRVPNIVCANEIFSDSAVNYGWELGLCTLAWIRREHVNLETGEIHPIIRLVSDRCLDDLIQNLGDWGRVECVARQNYLDVVELAVNHAVTARGNPEQDAMIPSELDTLTDLEIERRLRAVLAGEQVSDLVFRKGAFQ